MCMYVVVQTKGEFKPYMYLGNSVPYLIYYLSKFFNFQFQLLLLNNNHKEYVLTLFKMFFV